MWIEIMEPRMYEGDVVSRPARALWIEIPSNLINFPQFGVEAREGLVD